MGLKKRNPSATCETCPYRFAPADSCLRFPPQVVANVQGDSTDVYTTATDERPDAKVDQLACGEHPDFFQAAD
jgi:hypothetical protein